MKKFILLVLVFTASTVSAKWGGSVSSGGEFKVFTGHSPGTIKFENGGFGNSSGTTTAITMFCPDKSKLIDFECSDDGVNFRLEQELVVSEGGRSGISCVYTSEVEYKQEDSETASLQISCS